MYVRAGDCKEITMRSIAAFASLAALCLTSIPAGFAKTPPSPAKDSSGQIVIVFKDGHRQTFNLSDIARIDFSGTHESSATTAESTAVRGQFVGRWVVGVSSDSDDTFVITLKDDGNAMRSLHQVHGTWRYVNGEAQITWDDGVKDAIRKVGSAYQKYAYSEGKSFTDTPDNVTSARNTTPKPS
jgi:hypothetical protein